jgi:SAM-dependent methyltransferase
VEEVTCVDWQNTAHGTQHVDHVCDLTGPLPLADDAFDTVLLSDVLEHIPTPQRLMDEIARVLKPGGKLILNVPFLYWLHETPHDFHRYTEFALRRLAESARLDVVVLEPFGGPLEVIADIAAKRLVRVPGVGGLLSQGVQSVCRVWVACLRAVGRRRPVVAKFPSGYFLVAQKHGL